MGKSTSGKLALRLTGAVTRFIINIIFYLLVVTAVYKGATSLYRFSYEVFGSVARTEAPGTDVPVQIYRGETTMNIATKLETSLVIVDKYSFYFKTKLRNEDIMPGTYVLNTSMDYDEILDIITDAKNSIAEEESIESAQEGIGGKGDAVDSGAEDGTGDGEGAKGDASGTAGTGKDGADASGQGASDAQNDIEKSSGTEGKRP